MTVEKCCGTCGWWQKQHINVICGYCIAPLPYFMESGIDPQTMIDAGEHCPCYKPKDVEECK